MAQSLAQIYLHLVFSTKHRYPYLQEPALRFQMHAYLAGFCKNLESASLLIGGVADHVHILCRPSKNLAVADLLRELKRDSSKWIKERAPALSEFHWQAGYSATNFRSLEDFGSLGVPPRVLSASSKPCARRFAQSVHCQAGRAPSARELPG